MCQTDRIKEFGGWKAKREVKKRQNGKAKIRAAVMRHICKTLFPHQSHFVTHDFLREPFPVCYEVYKMQMPVLGAKYNFPVTLAWLWIYGWNCIACNYIYVYVQCCSATQCHIINKWTCAAYLAVVWLKSALSGDFRKSCWLQKWTQKLYFLISNLQFPCYCLFGLIQCVRECVWERRLLW